MRTVILVVGVTIILIVFLFVYLQKTNNKPGSAETASAGLSCNTVREGNFMFHFNRGKPDVHSWQIYRNDSIQTEVDLQNHDSGFFRIEWKDSCNYGLRLFRTTAKLTDEEFDKRRKNSLLTTITSVTEEYYLFTSHSTDINYEFNDTMWLAPAVRDGDE